MSGFFQRDFLGTPVNLLLSSQKCQGVYLFPEPVKIRYFAAAPMPNECRPHPSATEACVPGQFLRIRRLRESPQYLFDVLQGKLEFSAILRKKLPQQLPRQMSKSRLAKFPRCVPLALHPAARAAAGPRRAPQEKRRGVGGASGGDLSSITCPTQVFFRSGESSSKIR